MAQDAPVLEVRNITKTFPGVVANDDISFALRKGQVHCLLGENGAGKSTLMNVVFGLYRPDQGQVLVRGEPARFRSSRDAFAAGIGMVHQHFKLIPVLTVAENVILGSETTKGPFLALNSARKAIAELSERYGLAIDPDAAIGDLSVGEQQRVELVKALFRNAEILILDEPTAVLTPGEVDDFFKVVRTLVGEGKSIVFITHKLREVLSVADHITVLRHGRVVGSADPAKSTEQSLANLMVGRDVNFQVAKKPADPQEVALSVEALHVTDDRGLPAITDVTMNLKGGEIYGLAGVEGNGQRELIEALAGMRRCDKGTVTMLGTDTTNASPRKIHDLGVAHIPEDRGKHGLVGSYSLIDNMVLNQYHRSPFSKRGWRDRSAARVHTEDLVERFDVRTPSVDTNAEKLSGGNQQKVIVARELGSEPRLLLVAQPTRGLDVGSIQFIHEQLVAMRDRGVAVLLISAELDEVLNLADRIGVLYRGQIAGEFNRADATRSELGLIMASGHGEATT